MNNLPKKIVVLGNTWIVKTEKELFKGKTHWGYISYVDRTIYIKKRQIDAMWESFFHELMHLFFHQLRYLNLNKDEKFVHQLASVLKDTLVRNKISII